MKKNWLIKSIVMVVFVSTVASSCSVTYRERHPRYREREKVIITP